MSRASRRIWLTEPIAVLAAAVGFSASAATVADFVGQPIEVAFILDGVQYETGGGHVDDMGDATVSTPAGNLVLSVDPSATLDHVEWSVAYSAGGASDAALVMWNGRGWMGDFDLGNGWTVRVGEPGAEAPGQHLADSNVVAVLVAFGIGCLLYQVFIGSWRHRSVQI